MSSLHSRFARFVAAAAAVLLTAPLLLSGTATAGPAADAPYGVGLFGAQDPTYDGVYRQGLSLLALTASNGRIDPTAVRWLVRQQCPSGGWTSYRANPSEPCGAGDTNATAIAIMALHAVGRQSAARVGLRWLEDRQLRGGGWEYSNGWGADSNSTGLALQAFITMGVQPRRITNQGSGFAFLRQAQLRCSAPTAQRGALDYQLQATPQANDYATAQAAQALARTPLPVRPTRTWVAPQRIDCSDAEATSTSAAAAGYLARTLRTNDGAIPSAFGPGVDYGSTANAVLALVASGTARKQVRAGMATLESQVRDFVLDKDGEILPAAAALVVLAERATRGDPRDVDGMNLVARIQRSIAR